MESVRNRENIVLATDKKQLRKLVNSNNYRSHTIFSENLVMVHRQRSDIYLNKPIYLGQAVLDISKTHMYNFHYNYILKKYANDAQLLYTDTDSLVYKIETPDIYEDMQQDKIEFDFSDFPESHSLYSDLNKKVPGKFKDEANGIPISEFIALRSKLYCYTTAADVIKKAKGVKKQVVANEITFADYKACLLNKISIERCMGVFRSRAHNIFTETIKKIALDANDDKCLIMADGIATRALGYQEVRG